MSFLIILIISILLIVLCHIKGKSKIFPILLFGLSVLIIVCCNEGNDFKALEFRYDNWYFIEEFPIGFQLIFGLSKNLGLSFVGFKLVFAISILYFLQKFYNKYSIYPSICCALVFIYPCDSFYGQIRNGISAIIVVYAIMYYFDNDIDSKKKKFLKYIACIAIAAIIHPSSFIYIVVLIVNKRISPKMLILITVFSFGILIGFFYSGWISKIAYIIIKDARVLRWLKVGMFGNMFGSLSAAVGHIAWVVYLSYVKRLAIPHDEDWSVADNLIQKNTIEKIYGLNLISMVLIPMYFVTHAYFRIFKYLLFIDAIIAVQALYTRKRTKDSLAIMNVGMWTMSYLLSAMVSVGYRAIPNFYNSFDWSSLCNLFK